MQTGDVVGSHLRSAARLANWRFVPFSAFAMWRVPDHVSDDAVVILEVFAKKTRATTKHVVDSAKARLKKYQRDAEG